MKRKKVLHRGIEIIIQKMEVGWSEDYFSYQVNQFNLYDEGEDYDLMLEEAKEEIDLIIEESKP